MQPSQVHYFIYLRKIFSEKQKKISSVNSSSIIFSEKQKKISSVNSSSIILNKSWNILPSRNKTEHIIVIIR